MRNPKFTLSAFTSLTDAPAVIGTWISNTTILAVNVVARGTKSVGGQSTLPMLTLMGSIDTKCRDMFEPDAAHGTDWSSISMAVYFDKTNTLIFRRSTFNYRCFIPWKYSEFLTDLNYTTAYSASDRCTRTLSLEYIGYRNSDWCVYVSSRRD